MRGQAAGVLGPGSALPPSLGTTGMETTSSVGEVLATITMQEARSSAPAQGIPAWLRASTVRSTCHPHPPALTGTDTHVSDVKYQIKSL